MSVAFPSHRWVDWNCYFHTTPLHKRPVLNTTRHVKWKAGRGSSQNIFVRKKRSVSQVCRLLMLLVSLAPHSFMTPFMVLLRAIYLLIYWSDNYKKCWNNLIIRSPAKNPLYIVSKPQILHTFRISLLTKHRLQRNKMNSIILTHRPLLPSIPSMVSLYNRRVLFDHIKLLERTKRLLTATLAWSWKIGR